uniref:NAD(P)-binding domain-containing protein n=1 Tax=Staphylococcus epidermidis TaxID=1282 RepID=UPI0016434099
QPRPPELPKLFHYFKQPHPYFNQDLLIIPPKNSPLHPPLQLQKPPPNLTLLYPRQQYPKPIKPSILPNFQSLLNHQKITIEFNPTLTKITHHSLTYEKHAQLMQIHNHY